MIKILTQGHPVLQQTACPVVFPDPGLADELARLQQALAEFRAQHGFGRAIAAPQIGLSKRMIALHLGAVPLAVINPRIYWRSDEQFSVWDDCLSVPDHVVRVRRHRSISLRYQDEQGRVRDWQKLPESLSELLQHEIDHLDGLLMSDRAIDGNSIRPIAERAQLVDHRRRAHRLSLDRIRAAREVIDQQFLDSPQFVSDPLADALGCEVTLKLEFCNPIRSFKGRGAENFIASLDDRRTALVCASAGNFGQALAFSARRYQQPLAVFAAKNANPYKVRRMRELSAVVHLVGDDFDAAKQAAWDYARDQAALMIEDGREPAISEGAGTLAIELLARDDAFDALLVPLGNGALLAGVGRWVKAADPATQVIGICASGAPAMAYSFAKGEPVDGPPVGTIADGVAVRVPVPEAVADMQETVDEVLAVDDVLLLTWMRKLFNLTGLAVEPAGALAIAALAANRERFQNQRVAVVLTGSGLTDSQVRDWLFKAT